MPVISLIDSHAHIDMEEFDADRAEVIRRSEEAGVSEWVVPATTPASFRRLWQAPWRTPKVRLVLGVHPHNVADLPATVSEEFESLLLSFPDIVALGETGLDYFYHPETRERQLHFFEMHLDFASRFKRPLIVHVREAKTPLPGGVTAFGDALDRVEGSGLSGVFHCFTGTRADADRVIEAGWFLGFNGIMTFKQGQALRDVARLVPADRILLETDAPYLAPTPYRGKRNEPSYLLKILEELSRVREASPMELGMLITANTRRLFSLT